MPTGNQTTRFVIQLGDGGDPEIFAFTCGANTFGVTLTNNLGENAALDCDSPLDVPASIIRHLETQDTAVTISGMVTTQAWPTWRAWADDGSEKNVRLFLDEPAARNGGHWTLSAYLQQLELGKESSGKVTFSASIAGADQRMWTSTAPLAGDVSIFGDVYPATLPSEYGENILTEPQIALDEVTALSVQAGDSAIVTTGGQVTTDGTANVAARWVRQDAGQSVSGDLYGVIMEVSASDGRITPTGTLGGTSSAFRDAEVANYQAVVEATAAEANLIGATIDANVAATIESIRPIHITPLLEQPMAVFINITQSNWVGNSAGYTRTKHPYVPGALYMPGGINRGQGADVNGSGEPLPMMAMEPMAHQTLNVGGGPGAAFCAEVRKHLPGDHTVMYVASGYNGAGFKDNDFWDADGTNPAAYNGFWALVRQTWTRVQAWNPNSYLAGVNICVGESDLGGTITAGNLNEHMLGVNAIIDEVRAEPGWGEMPIVISEIGMQPGVNEGGANDANIVNIREAQQRFATGSGDATYEKTRCVFVPRPPGARYNVDTIHYEEDTNIVRGTLAGKAWHNLAYPGRTPLALDDTVPPA